MWSRSRSRSLHGNLLEERVGAAAELRPRSWTEIGAGVDYLLEPDNVDISLRLVLVEL